MDGNQFLRLIENSSAGEIMDTLGLQRKADVAELQKAVYQEDIKSLGRDESLNAIVRSWDSSQISKVFDQVRIVKSLQHVSAGIHIHLIASVTAQIQVSDGGIGQRLLP